MFSKELAILDRNTVKLMIDEMEEEVVEAKRKADEAVRKADEAESRAKQAEHREKQAREEVDNLKKELEKESDRSLLYECDVLITDRLSEESLFFNGGDISVLTEKELKEISGITSSTIEKMKNDCNRPKVIRLIDRNKALGELK